MPGSPAPPVCSILDSVSYQPGVDVASRRFLRMGSPYLAVEFRGLLAHDPWHGDRNDCATCTDGTAGRVEAFQEVG